jgi:hypothetical protein
VKEVMNIKYLSKFSIKNGDILYKQGNVRVVARKEFFTVYVGRKKVYSHTDSELAIKYAKTL